LNKKAIRRNRPRVPPTAPALHAHGRPKPSIHRQGFNLADWAISRRRPLIGCCSVLPQALLFFSLHRLNVTLYCLFFICKREVSSVRLAKPLIALMSYCALGWPTPVANNLGLLRMIAGLRNRLLVQLQIMSV
jgi:hypothetical protein